VDDIAAAQLELSRARLHPEVLLLALVPQQASLAYQLLADGARMDDATLTTILEPQRTMARRLGSGCSSTPTAAVWSTSSCSPCLR